MDVMGLDIAHIAALGTQVATVGAMRAIDVATYDLFEMLIAIAVIIYEIDPGPA